MRSPKCATCGHASSSHTNDDGYWLDVYDEDYDADSPITYFCAVGWYGRGGNGERILRQGGCSCTEYRRRWSKSRNHIPDTRGLAT